MGVLRGLTMVTKKHGHPKHHENTRPEDLNAPAHELTHEEGWEWFDREARARLGMSGEEFLRAWDAGEIDPLDPERHSDIVGQLMLLPAIGRQWTPR